MKFDADPTGFLGKSLSKVKATKTILNGLQWLLIIVAFACTNLILFGPADLRIVWTIMLCGIVLYFLAIYTYFALTDPDRLQSEEHREVMTVLSQPYQDDRGTILEGSFANTAPPQIAASGSGPALPAAAAPVGQPTTGGSTS